MTPCIGGNGDDVLIGGGGQDILDGGPGNNILIQSGVPAPRRRSGAALLSQAMAANFVTDGRTTAPACRRTRWPPSSRSWRRRSTAKTRAAALEMQMTTETDVNGAASGLEALLTLLHLQGVAADRDQIRHGSEHPPLAHRKYSGAPGTSD